MGTQHCFPFYGWKCRNYIRQSWLFQFKIYNPQLDPLQAISLANEIGWTVSAEMFGSILDLALVSIHSFLVILLLQTRYVGSRSVFVNEYEIYNKNQTKNVAPNGTLFIANVVQNVAPAPRLAIIWKLGFS